MRINTHFSRRDFSSTPEERVDICNSLTPGALLLIRSQSHLQLLLVTFVKKALDRFAIEHLIFLEDTNIKLNPAPNFYPEVWTLNPTSALWDGFSFTIVDEYFQEDDVFMRN